jgi:hypothetical protein
MSSLCVGAPGVARVRAVRCRFALCAPPRKFSDLCSPSRTRQARCRPASRSRVLLPRAGLTPESAQSELWVPWAGAGAGHNLRAGGARAEAPPMTPRFMDAGGPTDPMALLMRQRIVFLGTQARRRTRDCEKPYQPCHALWAQTHDTAAGCELTALWFVHNSPSPPGGRLHSGRGGEPAAVPGRAGPHGGAFRALLRGPAALWLCATPLPRASCVAVTRHVLRSWDAPLWKTGHQAVHQ